MRAIKNTLRYIRLYYYFVRFSFMRAMEFRVDFTFRIFMDVIYYAVNIALYKIIFLHTDQLGGWNENEALIFVAGYLLADSIYMTVFANNLWWLPYFINRGDLDYYLVRPVSSLFFLSLRDFAANSTINILAAVGIFAWATLTYQNHFYWYQLIVYIVLIFNGAFLFFLISLASLIPVFWIHGGRGLQSLVWSLQRFMERPDRIFYGWVRRILVSVLPFALIASVPAHFFLDQPDWTLIVHISAVSTGLFLLVYWFWRRGLRAYSSASS
ncbi:MAG: ABC-2 family transporter protein [Leptospiraceae bacterium]|nr:ABC-2 family transporter protein [Leptospiraceae bacterium]